MKVKNIYKMISESICIILLVTSIMAFSVLSIIFFLNQIDLNLFFQAIITFTGLVIALYAATAAGFQVSNFFLKNNKNS